MARKIQLTDPREAAEDLERLNYFAGRHLGEDEFEVEQRWREARLAPLLVGDEVGIVEGLRVRCPLDDHGTPINPEIIIEPGLAIAGDGGALVLSDELRPAWTDIKLGQGPLQQDTVYLVADPNADDPIRAQQKLLRLVYMELCLNVVQNAVIRYIKNPAVA